MKSKTIYIVKNILLGTLLLGIFFSCGNKENQNWNLEVKNYQSDLVAFYNSDESPVKLENKKDFNGLSFFPIDKEYKIDANFELINNDEIYNFETSSGRNKSYIRYGKLSFILKGKDYQLTVFQKSPIDPQYLDDLFLPFNDKTNNISSYGGGRYIDLKLADIQENKVSLDFNKAYNPYCAYEDGYSCPIPPKENELDIEIKAGVSYIDYFLK